MFLYAIKLIIFFVILLICYLGNVCCCYFSALVLACYHLKKGRATFYQPETIVASLSLLMVLHFEVIFNYTGKSECYTKFLLFIIDC